MSKFRIEKPFETRPPRLKDLVNAHVMGDVRVRDSPFGAVTDSLKIAEHFEINHKHILRSIDKCILELGTEPNLDFVQTSLKTSTYQGQKVEKEIIEK